MKNFMGFSWENLGESSSHKVMIYGRFVVGIALRYFLTRIRSEFIIM